jgi:hypothetical protein
MAREDIAEHMNMQGERELRTEQRLDDVITEK